LDSLARNPSGSVLIEYYSYSVPKVPHPPQQGAATLYHVRIDIGRIGCVAFFILSLTSGIVSAATESKSRSKPNPIANQLDEAHIHALYTDGEFETILKHFQGYLKAHPTHAKNDSILLSKYSGVILTANPETREKGKMHMFRLLSLWPDANFDEMLVSDEVDKTFEKVRKEFIAVKARGQAADLGPSKTNAQDSSAKAPQHQSPSSQSALAATISGVQARTQPDPKTESASKQPQPSTRKSGLSRNTMYWLAGGAAAIATTGAMVYLLSSSPKKGEDTTYVIPR
jgi:hypothetical protein